MWGFRIILLILVVSLSSALGILNFFAFQYDWYWNIYWFDWVMHFLGGWLIATVVVLIWASSKFLMKYVTWRSFLVLVLGSVLAIGGGWELFEFGVDTYWATHVTIKTLELLQLGARDSISDIIFGLLGGLISGLSYSYICRLLISSTENYEKSKQSI